MKIGDATPEWHPAPEEAAPAPPPPPSPRSLRAGRTAACTSGVQATLDQFLACIEDGDPAQRPVALVDFLLATTTLAQQIRRGGTPLSALQLFAMQAVTEAGIDDTCGAVTHVDRQGDAVGRTAPPPDQNPRREPLAEASAAPTAPFGLAEVKALLVGRMEAVNRARMLAGARLASPHHQEVDSTRFAMLPLLVLNAHRPRPPLHRRIAADRTALIRAGLALAQHGQSPSADSRSRVVQDTGRTGDRDAAGDP